MKVISIILTFHLSVCLSVRSSVRTISLLDHPYSIQSNLTTSIVSSPSPFYSPSVFVLHLHGFHHPYSTIRQPSPVLSFLVISCPCYCALCTSISLIVIFIFIISLPLPPFICIFLSLFFPYCLSICILYLFRLSSVLHTLTITPTHSNLAQPNNCRNEHYYTETTPFGQVSYLCNFLNNIV